jgi:hypothetical protein
MGGLLTSKRTKFSTSAQNEGEAKHGALPIDDRIFHK